MKYILIIILFASCNATKQSAKHLNKAFKKDRVYVAKVTRDSFPCTELFRTDTAFVYTDSTVWIECPDYHIADTGKMVHDTTTVDNKATVNILKFLFAFQLQQDLLIIGGRIAARLLLHTKKGKQQIKIWKSIKAKHKGGAV